MLRMFSTINGQVEQIEKPENGSWLCLSEPTDVELANVSMETGIDLNKELSENPLATFYIKVKGNSMIDAGINDKDVLVVDRSLEPQNNKIAICFIDGEFTVKRIQVEKDCLYLMPENPNYPAIKVTEENQLIIWGIVTYVIKKV